MIQYEQLYEHNKKAVDAIREHFRQGYKRAAVVHATGTGKSAILATIASEYNKVLVIAPNNFVLNESRKMCRLDTEFRTYASVMYDEEPDTDYDIIILDEFHRAGAEKWGIGVQTLIDANPNALLLGTSATHIRYLDSQRNMADELFDGHVVSYLPLKEALDKAILPTPIYVSSIYTFSEERERLRKRIHNTRQSSEWTEDKCRRLEGIAHNWDNAQGVHQLIRKYISHDMSRIIVFCSKIKRAAEAREMLSRWFGMAGFNRVRYYNIDYKEKRLETEMADFQEPLGEYDLKVAISVNMLNEGVHIPHVDGIIMLRSTISRIIIEQQVGRCLTSNNTDIKPVVLDLVNNMDLIRYDEIPAFNKESETESTNTENESKDYKGFPFKVIDECRDIRVLLEELEAEIVGNFTKEECIEEAKKYKSRHAFNLGSPTYFNCAFRNGWIDEVKPSDKKFLNRMSEEEALERAHHFKSRKEFKFGDKQAYAYFVNHNKMSLLDSFLPSHFTMWTDEMLAEEARKYNSRTDFFKGCQAAYSAASKRGILKEICSHMVDNRQFHTWTIEEMESFAIQCKTKKEWRERFKTSYEAACNIGEVDNICDRLGLKRRVLEDNESIISRAKEYKTSGELFKKDQKFYHVLHKRNLLREVFPEARVFVPKISNEELLERAKLCKDRKDLYENHRSTYNLLNKRGLMFMYYEMTGQKIIKGAPKGYWNLETCKEEALKFSTRKEWREGSPSSYNIAKKRRYINECCKHMAKR